MTPFLLKAPCKDYIWGGSRLREFGKVSDADRIAESWELSCHPDGESIIASGEWEGRTLTGYLAAHPEALGKNCRGFDRFPVLIKLIDAHDDLSVQVHPDDAYALLHEGEYGKTEMWYVLDAQPGAELIFGFAREVTREEFQRAIEENRLTELVRRVPVKPGDVFFIPSGTLHAIGRGLLIAEVQQNSNTTYRVYDYGRRGADGKPRELHIAKALEVTRLTPNPEPPPRTGDVLGECRYFRTSLRHADGALKVTAEDSFLHLLVTEGSALLRTDGGTEKISRGASIFLPAGTSCTVEGHCTMLETGIGQNDSKNSAD